MTGKELKEKVLENISKVIVGKDEVVTLLLTALLAEGHVLLEDVPGTGKTKAAKALAKSMDITLETDTTPANVNGNYQIIDEMVYNLVENAIKYNKNGGSVKVTIRNLAQSVVLSVHDTGIGIDKSEQEKIFERFYRVDKSHSKEIGGTGLGLSIVKHAAVYHDAEIEIESELDKGTVISVIFKR